MEKNTESFLGILASTGACLILSRAEKEKVQHKELNEFLNSHTLNARLHQFLMLGLIEHHISKIGKRTEWYTITEKGKETLRWIKGLEKIASS